MSSKAVVIADWDPLFTHYFPFSTLRSLGYRTRASVCNNSGNLGERREPARVSLSIYGLDGRSLLRGQDCATIVPGQYWLVEDVDDFASEHGVRAVESEGEWLCILHQTPLSQAESAAKNGGVVRASANEISGWMGMADDYVEYFHEESGGVGGVFYSGFFFNDPRLSSTWTTIIQSPKALFDDGLDPGVILLNISCNRAHNRSGHLLLSLLDGRGRLVGAGEVTVPPFTSRVALLRPFLSDPAYHGGATTVAVCADCTLIPISFVRDSRSMALAIDHTMPPGSYHSSWSDGARRSALAADLIARMRKGLS